MRTLDRIVWHRRIGKPAWGTVMYMGGFAIGKCIRHEWTWAVVFASISMVFLIVSLASHWMKP